MRGSARLARLRPYSLATARPWQWFWGAFSLLLIGLLARSALVILLADPAVQVQHTPDDAYYYLGLARAFARTGQWSFDGGVSVTSGFHPLWAYLLAAAYVLVRPDAAAFVRLGLGATAVLTLAALLWAWWLAWRAGRPSGLLVVAVLASAPHVARNAVSAVEWPLVVLCALGYGWLFWRGVSGRVTRGLGLALIVLGLLGSLARTDFGLLPLSVWLAGLVLARLEKRPELGWFGLLGLAGAAIGVVLTLVHNVAFTGAWLQSSARMKALWLGAQGGSLAAAFRLPGHIIGLEDPALGLLAVSGGGIAIVLVGLGLRRRERERPSSDVETGRLLAFLFAGGLTLLGYMLFYARSASVQPWYSANLLAPLLGVLSLSLDGAGRLWGRRRVLAGGSVVALALLAGNLTDAAMEAPWPHQAVMLGTGQALAETPLDGRVGSWNAGILGYYQGGGVINLDGLVNNDIYQYAATNGLADYIDSRDIRYVVDFARMVEDPARRRRGGYDDPAFLARLRPVQVFDDRVEGWREMTLWEVGRPSAERGVQSAE